MTGQAWQRVYAKSWVNTDRRCLARGAGDDVETEGVAFLTRDTIVESNEIRLPESRVALMMRTASVPDVAFVVTHLAASRRNQAHRVAQIAELLPWLARREPVILMGDLNARPGSEELQPLFARFRDAWVEASAHTRALGVRDGSTRPRLDSRIDYVLYDAGAPVRLESVTVVDTSNGAAIEASDHRPVVAAFQRRE